ncbi:hypothetical protein B4U79_17822 [Dinothrombium tinctorium]|uniref:PWWP domain-containing protein n=1 Tax=Dinothrombium tinctorium TaxID=1965070 RepID=A0A3S3PRY2_9ACAR|nr:hypothetical protein B4U79_17822 [Dinothrombium tinctorium]
MPHIVIYAKVPTHPFWPAKAIRYIAENKTVLVKFFGTHDYGFPPLKNCYLLSETYPGKEPNTAQYNAAKDELEKHIRKIKCKFTGLFRYFPFKTFLLLEFLKPEYQPTVVIKRDAFIDFSARYSKSFDELMSIFSEIRQEQPPQKTCDSPEKEE